MAQERPLWLIVLSIFLIFVPPTAFAAPIITRLSDPSGVIQGPFPHAVSADGTIVVGSSVLPVGDGGAFRWEAGVISPVAPFEPTFFPTAISADGLVISGTVGSNEENLAQFANGALSVIEPPDWCIQPTVYGSSNDGSVITGKCHLESFVWSSESGFTQLGQGGGNAISGDGSIVLGYTSIWTAADGVTPLDLSFLATDFSSDGSVIVGFDALSGHAIRWEAGEEEIIFEGLRNRLFAPYTPVRSVMVNRPGFFGDSVS